LLQSDFPYISVPSDLWSDFENSIKPLGFVCFRSAYTQLTVCQVSKPCSEVAPELNDLVVVVNEGDYEIVLASSMYLQEVSNTTC